MATPVGRSSLASMKVLLSDVQYIEGINIRASAREDCACSRGMAWGANLAQFSGYVVLLTWLLGSSFLYIFRTCQAVVLAFILSTLFIRTRLHPDNIKCALCC